MQYNLYKERDYQLHFSTLTFLSQIYNQIDRERDRQRERQIEREKERERERGKKREGGRERQYNLYKEQDYKLHSTTLTFLSYSQIERERERDRERERERKKERERERKRERLKYISWNQKQNKTRFSKNLGLGQSKPGA